MSKKKMKKKKKIKIQNFGNRLTFLTDEEATDLIRKYDYIIIAECKKRYKHTGMGFEDLAQECRIKILSGAHLYDTKRPEKTWIKGVIHNTISTITKLSLNEKRTHHLTSSDGTEKPVYNFSFESFHPPKELKSDESDCLFEEFYNPEKSNVPVFGSVFEPVETETFLMGILKQIENSLPYPMIEYIKAKIFGTDTKEKIFELHKILTNTENYHPSLFVIKSPECYGLDKRKENARKFFDNIISDFFTEILDVKKEMVIGREDNRKSILT